MGVSGPYVWLVTYDHEVLSLRNTAGDPGGVNVYEDLVEYVITWEDTLGAVRQAIESTFSRGDRLVKIKRAEYLGYSLNEPGQRPLTEQENRWVGEAQAAQPRLFAVLYTVREKQKPGAEGYRVTIKYSVMLHVWGDEESDARAYVKKRCRDDGVIFVSVDDVRELTADWESWRKATTVETRAKVFSQGEPMGGPGPANEGGGSDVQRSDDKV